jgi:carbamoyl-phosphate synthase large subunit
VSKELGSSMKSVGEIMAIGRTFEEVIQKGLRMIGQGMHGFIGNKELRTSDLENALSHPTDVRIFLIAQAFSEGYSIDRIWELTRIDKWFLYRLKSIFDTGQMLEKYHDIREVPDELILDAKRSGFSDFQLARLVFKTEIKNPEPDMLKVRDYRKKKNILPFVKQIDTLAAEYPAQTNYLYMTYSGSEHDVDFPDDHGSVIVLGSGAYRIGSSVEFDWCSVNTLNTVKDAGYLSIMINYNPETVSTDYDICDRLYFDELSFERVMDIIDLEDPKGIILSMGGQIPNNLAMRLHKQNVPVLGTSPVSVDNAEDRHKFSSMLDRLEIDQPRWKELSTLEDIYDFTEQVGFPVLIRPSYVLSGAAMNVVSNKSELEHFLTLATNVSHEHPVVVSEFIEDAKEIEIDAVAKEGEIVAYAISEHIEFAGVHSGDATIMFPPQKIYVETVRRIKRISRDIARSLQISGPFNIQFLAKDNDIKVIECNLRASRSFPFVSKVLKINFIDIATRVMLKIPFEKPDKSFFDIDYIGVKAPQFSFSRLQKADPMLGVDMASTGEVGCIGDTVYEAVLKSMLSVGYRIPGKNILISSGPVKSKTILLEGCRMLAEKKYHIFATKGTAEFLSDNGIDSTVLHWPDEETSPNVMEYMQEHKIDLVINIPKNLSKDELYNDYTIRRAAIDYNVPLITNANLANVFVMAFCKLKPEDLEIKSWQEY